MIETAPVTAPSLIRLVRSRPLNTTVDTLMRLRLPHRASYAGKVPRFTSARHVYFAPHAGADVHKMRTGSGLDKSVHRAHRNG